MITILLAGLAAAQASDDGEPPRLATVLAAPEVPADLASLAPGVLAAPVAAAAVPGVSAVQATVTRVVHDAPLCLVVVDWRLDFPSYLVEARSSGAGEADTARDACLAALQRAAEAAAAVVTSEVTAPPQATLSPVDPSPAEESGPIDYEVTVVRDEPPGPGERWMIRGGFTVGAGVSLFYLASIAPDSDLRTGVMGVGVVTGLVGAGMAAVGLAIGDDEPAKQVRLAPGPGLGLGITAALPTRRR